ncbi:MAG: hypothetical protein WKF57_03985 [Nakamurella sp.]
MIEMEVLDESTGDRYVFIGDSQEQLDELAFAWSEDGEQTWDHILPPQQR